jgi:perosamine synthetase
VISQGNVAEPIGLFEDQVPLLKPWLGQREVEAAAEVILSGWISQGPRVAEFENAVAKYIGVAHAVATNACTSALHLAIHLSGIGAGDEVICPSFTCMATANAIHHAGAHPVFAEIDGRTFNLDPAGIEEALTPATKAILLVHQIGLPADVDAVAAVAARHGLALIEDGACTFGGTYKGRRIGGIYGPTCFSFHPRKMITTGEGGMISTNDRELAEKARMLRATGASVSDLVRHKAKGSIVQQYLDVGYNYRMTDIQAAIGLVQLEKVGAMLEQRTAQARQYDAALADIEELTPPYTPDYATHAYSSYAVTLRKRARVDRDTLVRRMADAGVSCRVGIQPLHREPIYREQWGGLKLPVTEEAARTVFFLPIFPGMTPEQQSRVVDALKRSLHE